MNRSLLLPSRLSAPSQHASLAQDGSILTRIDPHLQIDISKHLPFLSLDDNSTLTSADCTTSGGLIVPGTDDDSCCTDAEDTSVSPQQVDVQPQEKRSIFGGTLKIRKSSADASSLMTESTMSDTDLSSEGFEAPRPKSILRNKSLNSSSGDVNRRQSSRMSGRCQSFDDEIYSQKRKLGFPKQDDRRSKSCSQMMKVSFASRVRVLEFERSKDEEGSNGLGGWFTPLELAKFKAEAVRQMREERARLFIGGRTKSIRGADTFATRIMPVVTPSAAFATPIMPVVTPSTAPKLKPSITQEIQNILVIDAHDIFLKLFSKALKEMMPHVKVVTAKSAIEALRQIEISKLSRGNRLDTPTHGFDIVVAEERLNNPPTSTRNYMARTDSASKEVHSSSPDCVGGLFLENKQESAKNISYTGSQLIGFLNQQEKVAEMKGVLAMQRTFLIGVSAFLEDDSKKLRNAGANLLWSKPPPRMDNTLRDTVLSAVLKKRGKK